MAPQEYTIAIIGGGIIGLATGMELLTRHPGMKLVILEKDGRIAAEQTGHNSGVIHSGIYYTPESLKAKLCVQGSRALMRFCDERGIKYERIGKVIVATDEKELLRLEDLYRRGIANGVPGVEMIGPERLKELEPHVIGIKAIYSPNTGIVDYKQVSNAYAAEVTARGGEILSNREIVGIKRADNRVIMETRGGIVKAHYVISCAGLQSDRVAQMTGAPADPKIVPFRGDYYVLRPDKRALVNSLIYPVPDPAFPFLGAHFTPHLDQEILLGPNAVLAFAREGYGRYDVNLKDLWDALSYPGFQRLALKYWKVGIAEMYRDYVKRGFLKALQRYMPELRSEDLLPGPSGVRAQAVASNGSMVDDFVVHQSADVVHVRNAPSPAATSSLAIGAMIADMVESNFTLEAKAS